MRLLFQLNTMRLFLIAFASVSVLAAGCSRFPEEKIPRLKMLVADFDMPPGMRETPKEIRGWWLGADSIYQNPRAGAMFAECLSHRLTPFAFVNLYSRTDLKYYFSRKRQLLKESYDYLNDDELDALLAEVPKVEYARELKADKLLAGRIFENQLTANRTFHWWSSRARIECTVTDVLTGEVEWKKTYRLKRRFSSQFSVQDEIAAQVAKDLKKNYFRPMAYQAESSPRRITTAKPATP